MLVLSDNTPINTMPHHLGGNSSEESSLNKPTLPPLLTNGLGEADASCITELQKGAELKIMEVQWVKACTEGCRIVQRRNCMKQPSQSSLLNQIFNNGATNSE